MRKLFNVLDRMFVFCLLIEKEKETIVEKFCFCFTGDLSSLPLLAFSPSFSRFFCFYSSSKFKRLNKTEDFLLRLLFFLSLSLSIQTTSVHRNAKKRKKKNREDFFLFAESNRTLTTAIAGTAYTHTHTTTDLIVITRVLFFFFSLASIYFTNFKCIDHCVAPWRTRMINGILDDL